MSNRSTQKAKRGTKTRVPGSKKGKNKPKKPTKQTTIQSGLKRLAAKKGKLVTDSVKRKHVDQVIDDVVLGRVCETRSNCPEPTSLIDGPRMNVSSALAHTEVDANGTVEQVGVIQNDSTAMLNNDCQQDEANAIPQNGRQQVTNLTEQPAAKHKLNSRSRSHIHRRRSEQSDNTNHGENYVRIVRHWSGTCRCSHWG